MTASQWVLLALGFFAGCLATVAYIYAAVIE